MVRTSDRIVILNTSIDNLSMDAVIDRIVENIEARTFSYAVTPNVDHLMKLRTDATLRSIYQDAQLVLPDGVPLLWASAILGTPLKQRINGTDLFERLCEVAALRGYSVYLLGGNPGTAGAAARVLAERNPGLRVAGWDCPECGFEEDPVVSEQIRKRVEVASPDILFVALGAPKQEKWIEKYARTAGVYFAVGIGISFSLICGEVKRAPTFMQRAGFEWLWRLLAEPRRLWKRYLVDDMPFLVLIGYELFRKRLLRGFGQQTTPSQ